VIGRGREKRGRARKRRHLGSAEGQDCGRSLAPGSTPTRGAGRRRARPRAAPAFVPRGHERTGAETVPFSSRRVLLPAARENPDRRRHPRGSGGFPDRSFRRRHVRAARGEALAPRGRC
jgi:hypothetical protein